MSRLKYFLCFLLLATSLCCGAKIINSTANARSSSSVVSKIVSHSVTIEARVLHQSEIIGSGVVVRRPRLGYAVLTAEHVPMSTIDLDGMQPEFFACSFNDKLGCFELGDNFIIDWDSSTGTDWAVFLVDSVPKGITPAPIETELPNVGEAVIVSGIPLGRVPWISHGHVAWVWTDFGSPVIGVDGFAFFGSSGGGVYNSSGNLVGLISAMEVSEWGLLENKVIAVPIQNIKLLH